LMYLLIFNVPFLSKMLYCCSIKTVLLYTTSITNAWGLLFFIV
jgi:hypothetical protein